MSFRCISSLLLTGILLTAPHAWGSGSFSPSGVGPGNPAYNLGKALVNGRKGDGCVSCHQSFKRAKLKKLKVPVGLFVSQCDQHQPCLEKKLNRKEREAISAYFKKRYRLKN